MTAYVTYVDDEPVGVYRNITEAAEALGIKRESAQFLTTPAYRKRGGKNPIVKVDMEEE